jgi:hypothetical protein
MTDGVYALVHPVQEAPAKAAADGVVVETEQRELRSRDESVLASRDLRDPALAGSVLGVWQRKLSAGATFCCHVGRMALLV